MARSVRLGAFSSVRDLARGLSTIGAAALAAATLSVGAMGCAPGNPGLVVVNAVAPTDDCVWDPSATLFVGEPTFDLDPLTPAILAQIGAGEVRPAYIAQLLVLNNLINRFNTSYPVMADPNFVTVTGAEVELLSNEGRRLPSGFYRTRASGTVGSALGDQPGRGLVRVDVIPGTVAEVLANEFAGRLQGDGLVTARVVVIGVTQGGTELRTSPFVLPIQLCYGCLYNNNPLMVGESPGCTPGQDGYYSAPSYTRTPPCVVSDDCASGLCVLGHCARDLL
jgi:hypothetical protein